MVILGIYEDNCMISLLFCGMLRKLKEKFFDKAMFGIMEKKEYEANFIKQKMPVYPKIIVYINGKKIKEIEGFTHYDNVYQQIIA